jgi:uncharacterized protein Smg (DUF494 family)
VIPHPWVFITWSARSVLLSLLQGIYILTVDGRAWELSTAVRASSQLPSREELSTDLYRFGFLTRDVKDAIIRINSLAINTFSWTLREFNRVEQMLSLVTYSDKDIAKSLDIFFERLAMSFGCSVRRSRGAYFFWYL